MHFFILLCLIPSALISTVENKKPKSHPNKFIATNEWKTIEEGKITSESYVDGQSLSFQAKRSPRAYTTG